VNKSLLHGSDMTFIIITSNQQYDIYTKLFPLQPDLTANQDPLYHYLSCGDGHDATRSPGSEVSLDTP
jgi:hypothetical protein